MKNKSLLALVTFSSLAMPVLSHAKTEGVLSIMGKDPITLEQHAGRSIQLNKGSMEILIEKSGKGFSVVAPRLVIKQNEKALSISIPNKNYHNSDNFTLLAKDSDLSHDLYLRKSVVREKGIVKTEEQSCTYQKYTSACGINLEGAYVCGPSWKFIIGKKIAKNTYESINEVYKLTLAQGSVVKGEFMSKVESLEKVSSEIVSQCK